MSLKKVSLLALASLAALSTVNADAGGPDALPPCMGVCAAPFTPYAYIGGAAGWAYSDWDKFILDGATNFGIFTFTRAVDTDGFAYGGHLGFQATDNFGIEGGIFGLPNSVQSFTIVAPGPATTISGKVTSWFAYGAGTIRAAAQDYPAFHLIAKVGGVYRAVNHSGTLYDTTGVGDGSYWTVLFGAGFDYDLGLVCNLPISLGLEYLLVPGSCDSWLNTSTGIQEDAAPAAHVGLATINLKFAV